MTIKLIWKCLFLLFISANLMGQNTASSSLSNNKILIGDHIKMTLRLSLESGTEVEDVGLKVLAESESAEIVDLKEFTTVATEPTLIMMQEILLTSYDSGYHLLQPIPVVLRSSVGIDTIYTNDLGLTVTTLDVSQDADLQPNKDIVEEPSNWRDYAPYVGAILAVFLLVWLVWRFVEKDVKEITEPPPPPLPPSVIALHKLEKIKAQALWREGKIKAFQSDLTFVFREYLENRFKLPALEATTAEIMAQISGIVTLKDWKEDIRKILQQADMVKFAKGTLSEEENETALEKIATLVETTKMVQKTEKPEQEND